MASGTLRLPPLSVGLGRLPGEIERAPLEEHSVLCGGGVVSEMEAIDCSGRTFTAGATKSARAAVTQRVRRRTSEARRVGACGAMKSEFARSEHQGRPSAVNVRSTPSVCWGRGGGAFLSRRLCRALHRMRGTHPPPLRLVDLGHHLRTIVIHVNAQCSSPCSSSLRSGAASISAPSSASSRSPRTPRSVHNCVCSQRPDHRVR